MKSFLKWSLLLTGEAALAALVGLAFWYQDWQYSLPTPRPAELKQPAVGEMISLASFAGADTVPGLNQHESEAAGQAVTLFHFFNPACPCSQFNLDHVRQLQRQFEGQVRVVAVLQSDDPPAALAAFRELKVPCDAIVDEGGAIAKRMGVYSTPQGVVLDRERRLYFRGNYNRSRYCTSPETEYARLAIVDCLAGKPAPRFDAFSATARGCELPANQVAARRGN